MWNAITPNEPAEALQLRERRERDERRLYLLAETDDGLVVGCGFAGASDSSGRGFLSPRVLPDARRRGLGGLLLSELTAPSRGARVRVGLVARGWARPGIARLRVSLWLRRGRSSGGAGQARQPRARANGSGWVTLITVAERPELLREAYDLAVEGYSDMATAYPVTISLDD